MKELFPTQLIASALQQNIPTSHAVTGFTEITTDSRKIKPGALFVAIRGETFDGHQFIASAVRSGALGVVHETGDVPSPALSFRVPSTLEAMRQIAGHWREQFSIPLIAVTGSVGKTTTKELLASILRGKYPSVLQTRASENGYLGIAMTLLQLRPEHQTAVIEIGIDEIGAMQKHLELVKPDVCVLTAVGPEHLEKLIDLQTVTREEVLSLTYVAERGGFIAVNLDDRLIQSAVAPWLKRHEPSGEIVSFSLRQPEPELLELLDGHLQGEWSQETLRISGMEWDAERFTCPLPGEHNARNLLASIAVARFMALGAAQIRAGLSKFSAAFGRSDLKTLPDGTRVYCDFYNANPSSMQAAFEVFAALDLPHPNAQRWLCLADMRELGSQENQLHADLASPISKHFTREQDHVLLFGPLMENLEASLRGKISGQIKCFADRALLSEFLRNNVKKGDLILIKGSRSMQMEQVWTMLQSQHGNPDPGAH